MPHIFLNKKNFYTLLLNNTSVHYIITFLGILTSILIARSLGPEGRGHYSFIILYIFLLNEVLSIGSYKSLSFFVAKNPLVKDTIIRFYHKYFSIPVTIVNFIIIIIIFINVDTNLKLGYLIFSLYIPIYVFFHIGSHILHGINEFSIWNKIRVFQSFIWLLIIVILFFYKSNINFKDILLSQLISHTISSILYFYYSKKIIIIQKNKERFYQKKEFFRYSFKNFNLNIIFYIYANVDLILISMFFSLKELGIYSLSKNLANLSIPLFTSFCEKVFQKSINNFSRSYIKKTFLNLFFLSIVGVFMFILFGQKIIILLYGESFSEIYNYTLLLLLYAIPYGFNLIFVDIFRAQNNFRFITYIYLFFLITIFLFSYFMKSNIIQVINIIIIINLLVLLINFLFFKFYNNGKITNNL